MDVRSFDIIEFSQKSCSFFKRPQFSASRELLKNKTKNERINNFKSITLYKKNKKHLFLGLLTQYRNENIYNLYFYMHTL